MICSVPFLESALRGAIVILSPGVVLPKAELAQLWKEAGHNTGDGIIAVAPKLNFDSIDSTLSA